VKRDDGRGKVPMEAVVAIFVHCIYLSTKILTDEQ
jgi:hypothetical protein